MIRREGDLAGEWDRMRLVERQKMISGEDRTTFSRKKRRAENKMEGAREREPFGCPRRDKISNSRKHRNESPVFESPERPNLSTRKHDLTILLETS